jgi:hypothetical protein
VTFTGGAGGAVGDDDEDKPGFLKRISRRFIPSSTKPVRMLGAPLPARDHAVPSPPSKSTTGATPSFAAALLFCFVLRRGTPGTCVAPHPPHPPRTLTRRLWVRTCSKPQKQGISLS